MTMAVRLLLAASALGTFLQVAAAVAHPGQPCRCLYAGGAAEQGETVCIERDGKRELARCEMVLNNTSWRFLGSGCDVAAGRDRAVPAS